MASSSNFPLRQTDPETLRIAPQKDPLPKTCLRLYSDEDAGRRLTNEEYRLSLLNNGPIPNFDWRAVPPAGIGPKFDVFGRVEELQKYLRENTYPNQRENIMAAIDMYNRKELPTQDTPRVYLQDGKLVAPTMNNVLRPEPIWREGSGIQYMQAHGHYQALPRQSSTVFGYNPALGGAEILLRVTIPPHLGGNGLPVVVRALNDTGSNIMTLDYNEALGDLGWQPALSPPQLIQITTPGAVTLHESISVMAQACDYTGAAFTGQFVEDVVLRHFTGEEVRLSGSAVRNQLYFGTAPRLSNLYVARNKTRQSQVLPNFNQLP
ncbi:uncharacterized protein Z518_08748 [Rhinocladiella mackenziei CBS 650.93]|uniref:Uncharacterized protein n=1 Tax=Rhinocladiella mackenziei CBS 650.93 TaxID=1442369 RepID=A0A0D2J1M8_9EURO|nr:uncharacterized protein Z518_08748 [Rhinocladiella mackenziei CBS 650.93]KIX02805.1 hypothetical protein Z518_08748 [Rhinocladiella mackenziei CBS 650.93]